MQPRSASSRARVSAWPWLIHTYPPMTKRDKKVLRAIADLGGEASGFQIHQHLVAQSKWAWLWAIGYGGMYNALDRLEHGGLITSRWGEATAERGWRRPRIYSIPF